MTLQIGSLLKNRYRIEKVIARGGMGAIYAAFDESLSVRVAVKENLFASDESTRQFRREATILASLRHSNLPRVTDHFVFPDQGQYLVMDFIEGEDLKDRITRTGTLPEEEVAMIGAAICDALLYMHTRKPPIVHRDIKPGNIKITPNGEIFLVDFGIAKISQPGHGTTVGAQSLTPGFAPPEQYGQGTDARTDVYSLGATLYLALTGVVPANGLSRMMGQEELTPILQINPHISERFARVIEKALEVRKENRYQTAEDFLQALMTAHQETSQKRSSFGTARLDPAPTLSTSDAIKRKPTQPGSPAQTQPDSVPVQKTIGKKAPLLIGGIILVVLCAAAIAAVFAFDLLPATGIAQNTTSTIAFTSTSTNVLPSHTPLPPTLTPTSQPTEIQAVALEETPTEAFVEKLELSPTPKSTPLGGGVGQILFVSDRSGKPQLYTINSDGGDLQQITDELDGACQPDWSPGGDRIVYVSPCSSQEVINPQMETHRGSTLFIINSDGTRRIPLASFPGGDFDPSWSPDGSAIAFTTYRDNLSSADLNIYLYDLENNSVSALTSDLNSDRRPVWSPDGEQIVFQRQPQGGSVQINVMQADGTGAFIFSDQQLNNAFMPDWSINDIIVFSRGNPFPLPISRPLTPRNAQEIQLSQDPAWDLDFSPDGYWLVFERVVFQADSSRNHDIYLMSAVGGSGIRLTEDPARDYHPVWRPTGVQAKD